jgi:6-phosphogluconolactonase
LIKKRIRCKSITSFATFVPLMIANNIATPPPSATNHPRFACIGCWDMHNASGKGNGFVICRYDGSTGALELPRPAFPNITVGAACFDARRNVLYCTNESANLPGYFLGGGGQVYALAIDPATGELAELNHLPSFGCQPSSLALDQRGDHLVVTHHTGRVPVTHVRRSPAGRYEIELVYDDATTVLFPLQPNGAIDEPCYIHTHSGNGGPLARQTHPQLHSVTRAPAADLFLVCDKGNDQLVMFRINRAVAELEACASVHTVPGSSPRYSAFHPTLPFLFVNHETKAVVSSFHYTPDGHMEPLCVVSSLADGCPDHAEIRQSDLVIHPSGRHLYSLLRGIDAVSVFAIDQAKGTLERVATLTLNGVGPRGCQFSPDGRFLYVATLTSGEVLTWSADEDGGLAPTPHKLKVPNAASITFV